MKEISMGMADNFAKTGGILGMVIFSLVLLILAILYFAYWYIKTDRVHKMDQVRHSADQYERRLEKEEMLANSFYSLAAAIRAIPCIAAGISHGDIDESVFERRQHGSINAGVVKRGG